MSEPQTDRTVLSGYNYSHRTENLARDAIYQNQDRRVSQFQDNNHMDRMAFDHMKSPGGATTGRRSEIHRNFMRSYKPSQTSFHPGGKGLEFVGQPSTREMIDELSYGHQTSASYKAQRSIGRQILSKDKTATSHTFPKDRIPEDFGGRSGFLKMPSAYGTMSTGMLNDMEHIKTRPHCYDTRAYGTCLGAANASWETESTHIEPPRVIFPKKERVINPLAWGRRY